MHANVYVLNKLLENIYLKFFHTMMKTEMCIMSVNVKVNSHGLTRQCALFYTYRVAVQPQCACHF